MKKTNIFIAGHDGMVGSAITRYLKKFKKYNLITKERIELDLRNQASVNSFFNSCKIDQIYLCAAKVGGIYINNAIPANFLYDNVLIESNIIHSAFKYNIKKLIFLGSSCIYPAQSKQPIKEKELLQGPLEVTNEAYSISKIVGIKLCQYYNNQYGKSHNIDYRCVMPTNLYGKNDKYNILESHVIPSLILRFHCAKVNNDPHVSVWGTGKVKREFLFVDDLAKACHLIMNTSKKTFYKITDGLNLINIGYGKDLKISDLSLMIKKIVGYEGTIKYDKSKPDGVVRKLLNSKKISKLGWKPSVRLKNGLKLTYDHFLNEYEVDCKKIKAKKKIKVNNKKIFHPLVQSSWDHEEQSQIHKVINSNQFTMDKNVKIFEKKFSKFIKSKYSVMVNSGSSANLLMIASLFYKKNNPLNRGDEVIVPATSWSTTFTPLQQYGLKLIFVDIDKETLVMDVKKLKEAISSRTRLIVAVNLLGNSNHFSEINKLISKKNIYLVEDSCQAMGTKYKNKFTGTFGIAGSFSTFFSHHLNTMEGGLVTTDSEEIYQIILSLRAHGWIRDLPKLNHVMNKSGNFYRDSFSFALPGYNLRPLELTAAIGLSQLKKLPRILRQRRKNALYLKKIFQNHPYIYLQKEIGLSSWFSFALIIKKNAPITRDNLLEELASLGFETRPISSGNFQKNKVIKFFNYEISGNLANCNFIEKNGICIGNNHTNLKKNITTLKNLLIGKQT